MVMKPLIKRSRLVLVTLAFGFIMSAVSCGTPSSHPDSPEPQLFDGNWDTLRDYEIGLIKAEVPSLKLLQDATVYHIDLVISANLLTLTGREQVRYTNREVVDLDKIYFRLFPNVSGGQTTISGVLLDTEKINFDMEYGNSALRVILPEVLKPGNSITLDIDFTVDIPQSPSGNYGLFGFFNDILALDSWYPVIPVYDNNGWHIELGPPYGDKTFLDASFYLVRVTSPADLVFVTSGSEIRQEVKNGEKVLTFIAGPVRDFYLAASSRFTRTSSKVGETTINNYTVPEIIGNENFVMTIAADSLKSYNARFGEYPYKELDIVPLNMESNAMGIEYPGVFGFNVNIYTRTDILEATVAHEVGHQWFYNIVGNDQVNEPWLDEAMTQYITGLYYLDRYGEDGWSGFRQSWINRWNKANQQAIPVGLSVAGYTADEYGPIVYGRGPLFIEALADKIGAQTFKKCLRSYYQANMWQIATTESFRNHFETCTTSDLSTLFEEWVLP
jgi:hypothetical protein